MDRHIELDKCIGYTFSDRGLLQRALTHRSFSNENKNSPNNERLEFLGDAVLQYVVTDFLYKTYPDLDEGVLSMYRSALVKTEFLSVVGEKLSFLQYLRASVGQKRLLEKSAMTVIADAVEALIGAIYLDGGLEVVKKYIYTHILSKAQGYLEEIQLQDSKTLFQELVQKHSNATPTYVIESETGLAHDPLFTVAVMVDGEKIASGKGKSKQQAAQKAAKKALDIYKSK